MWYTGTVGNDTMRRDIDIAGAAAAVRPPDDRPTLELGPRRRRTAATTVVEQPPSSGKPPGHRDRQLARTYYALLERGHAISLSPGWWTERSREEFLRVARVVELVRVRLER